MLLEGSLPSGRERAIETLIDMEPHGAMHRAARVLVRVIVEMPMVFACTVYD